MAGAPANGPALQAVSRSRLSIQKATRMRSSSVSLEATGGMVRLRSCAATLRHRPRSESISLTLSALRKLAGPRPLVLWQAPQFSINTGRMEVAKSTDGSAARAALLNRIAAQSGRIASLCKPLTRARAVAERIHLHAHALEHRD